MASDCPDCGTALPPDANFCHDCGTPVGEPSAGSVPRGGRLPTMSRTDVLVAVLKAVLGLATGALLGVALLRLLGV